ncbi:pVII [Ovine adenovirus 8]|uniref:Pre-histone-like nucleoprotein n=1 Tax=Ovine adenovirus 8 TaxID=2601527 RepID=A0A5B8MBL1_9ADEN|nr:pVII [Ovine adenovirus 8]QDZ17464.1 pVII [Ovine adenovirus 8]
MAILISPSNNTGWGLMGCNRMYGGARVRSDAHPVRVRGHYRAAWGSRIGRVPRGRRRRRAALTVGEAAAVADAVGGPDAVADTIEAVVAEARRYGGRRRRGARRVRRSGRTALARRVRSLRRQVARARRVGRRAAAIAADAALAAAAPRRRRRRSVLWVRDAASGVRVPVTRSVSATV